MFTTTFKNQDGKSLSMDELAASVVSFLEGYLEAEIGEGYADEEDIADLRSLLRDARLICKCETDVEKAHRMATRFDSIIHCI